MITETNEDGPRGPSSIHFRPGEFDFKEED